MATAPDRVVSKDFLRVADLTPARLAHLLDLAAAMEDEPLGWVESLRGRSVACFFAKPSTRTRVSFAAAAARLGLSPIVLRPDELQLGRGEPIADTARALSAYCDAIVIRTFAQRDIEETAAAASVPVINALSDAHHPCQALADVLTVREWFGRLEGVRLAFVGDGNNVAHSLLEAGALTGMEIAVASPPGYAPSPQVVADARALARTTGAAIEVVEDPRDAVRGAHAVYTDVWVSMGDDAERDERLRDLRPYEVNEELLALARPDAIFMHCLPAHRGEEVAAAVIDGARSVVWEQAANRESTAQALLYTLISGDWGAAA
ncbi:MAG TPA: ornithine carbamoyltransferase [Gaiellaceae bacterium]|jgi:ornithine carbamoyltransferase|nr:ornithine carbamoyltransferase [Gaiellaceae bacterium]